MRELVPLDPAWVTPKLGSDWTLTYTVQRPGAGRVDYGPDEILHLMGPSEDGIRGLSLVEYAGEVLGLALRAQRAASRLFRQGVMAGGALYKDNGALSPEGAARLREQMDALNSGAGKQRQVDGAGGGAEGYHLRRAPQRTARTSKPASTRSRRSRASSECRVPS